jgi:hypothetical protein
LPPRKVANNPATPTRLSFLLTRRTIFHSRALYKPNGASRSRSISFYQAAKVQFSLVRMPECPQAGWPLSGWNRTRPLSSPAPTRQPGSQTNACYNTVQDAVTDSNQACHGYLDRFSIIGHYVFSEGWANHIDSAFGYRGQPVTLSEARPGRYQVGLFRMR